MKYMKFLEHFYFDFGGYTLVYLVTVGFIVLDFLTGVIQAVKNQTFSSSVMRTGLFNKIGFLVCIAFGLLCDYAQGYIDISISLPIAKSICTYIILTEIGSIIENLAKINDKIVPEKMRAFFSKLKKEE